MQRLEYCKHFRLYLEVLLCFPSLEYVQLTIPYSCAKATFSHSSHFFTLLRPLGQTLSQYLTSFDIRAQGTGNSFNQIEAIGNSVQEQPYGQASSQPLNASASIVESNQTLSSDQMAEPEQSSVGDNEDDKEITSLPARRSYKYDDPPIVFNDVDVCMPISSIVYWLCSLLGSCGHHQSRGNGCKSAQSSAATIFERAIRLFAIRVRCLGDWWWAHWLDSFSSQVSHLNKHSPPYNTFLNFFTAEVKASLLRTLLCSLWKCCKPLPWKKMSCWFCTKIEKITVWWATLTESRTWHWPSRRK